MTGTKTHKKRASCVRYHKYTTPRRLCQWDFRNFYNIIGKTVPTGALFPLRQRGDDRLSGRVDERGDTGAAHQKVGHPGDARCV